MLAGYRITISAGELIDRLLIEQVRTEMSGAGDLRDPSDWSEAQQLLNALDEQLVEKLLRLHRHLWVLEAAVRDSSKASGFLENARSIFAANDERHLLKAQIDIAFPTSASRKRTYGANS